MVLLAVVLLGLSNLGFLLVGFHLGKRQKGYPKHSKCGCGHNFSSHYLKGKGSCRAGLSSGQGCACLFFTVVEKSLDEILKEGSKVIIA